MLSRLTAAMIESNEVRLVENTAENRWECWTVKDGELHALMLSAPLDKKQQLEDCVAKLKAEHKAEPVEPTQPPSL